MAVNCPAYSSHLQRKLVRSCPLLDGALLSCLPHAMEGVMGYCSLPTYSLMYLLWTRRYEIGCFHGLKILLAALVLKSKILRTFKTKVSWGHLASSRRVAHVLPSAYVLLGTELLCLFLMPFQCLLSKTLLSSCILVHCSPFFKAWAWKSDNFPWILAIFFLICISSLNQSFLEVLFHDDQSWTGFTKWLIPRPALEDSWETTFAVSASHHSALLAASAEFCSSYILLHPRAWDTGVTYGNFYCFFYCPYFMGTWHVLIP